MEAVESLGNSDRLLFSPLGNERTIEAMENTVSVAETVPGPRPSAPNPRLAARRLRIRRLRRRVTSFAIAVFAVAWVAIFSQLASGNDPVLGQAGNGPGAQAKAPPPGLTDAQFGLAVAPQTVAPTPLTTSQS